MKYISNAHDVHSIFLQCLHLKYAIVTSEIHATVLYSGPRKISQSSSDASNTKTSLLLPVSAAITFVGFTFLVDLCLKTNHIENIAELLLTKSNLQIWSLFCNVQGLKFQVRLSSFHVMFLLQILG